MKDSKKARHSKTLWFNALALAVLCLPVIQAWAGATALVLPLWVTEVLALLIPLANIGLRFVTNRPVSLRRRDG